MCHLGDIVQTVTNIQEVGGFFFFLGGGRVNMPYSTLKFTPDFLLDLKCYRRSHCTVSLIIEGRVIVEEVELLKLQA